MIRLVYYERKKRKVSFPSILYSKVECEADDTKKFEKDDTKICDIDEAIPPMRSAAKENDYISVSELMAEEQFNIDNAIPATRCAAEENDYVTVSELMTEGKLHSCETSTCDIDKAIPPTRRVAEENDYVTVPELMMTEGKLQSNHQP